jgi:hypothetical protein
MITFKDFLQEALKPSLYRPLVKGWDSKRLEDIFRSSSLEKDRRAFRLYFQFPQEEIKVEPNPVVTTALKDLGYEVDDYKLGLAIKDRRKIRIGKVLSKNPAALKVYMEDPARAGTQKKYEGVISRHPYDIASMSTHRGWTSCQDFIESPKTACEYVPADIQAGTLIAYMIKTSDRDIKSPVGRILIKPYINTKGETGYGMANISYGTVTEEFKESVENFVDWLNKQRKVRGLFQLAPKVYQGTDASSTALIGNDYSESELVQIVSNDPSIIGSIRNPSEKVQLAAVEKDFYSLEFIKNPTEKVQLFVITRNPNMIELIKNPTEKVQLATIKGNSSLIRLMVNPTEKVQLAAIENSIRRIQYIKNPTEKVQLAVIKNDPHLIWFIKNPTEKVQLEVIGINPNLIDSIKDPTERVLRLAAVTKDPSLIEYIKNPTSKVIHLAKQLQGK